MQLPFYEAVGVTGEYNVTQDPQKCRWEQKVQKGLTVQSVTGKGLCLGQVKDRNFLCTSPNSLIRRGIFYPQTIAGGHALSWDSLSVLAAR